MSPIRLANEQPLRPLLQPGCRCANFETLRAATSVFVAARCNNFCNSAQEASGKFGVTSDWSKRHISRDHCQKVKGIDSSLEIKDTSQNGRWCKIGTLDFTNKRNNGCQPVKVLLTFLYFGCPSLVLAIRPGGLYCIRLISKK